MTMHIKEPGTFRVLAVDDEDSILDLYKSVLSWKPAQEGNQSEMSKLEEELFGKSKLPQEVNYVFDLTVCRQGDEAVSLVRQAIEQKNPFAVVLLDVRMPPGPDGVSTAVLIREKDPMIEILMVTGFSDVDPADIARRVTPPHKLLYMQKPFHPHEIYQFVCTLCSKWKNENIIKNYNEKLLLELEAQTSALSRANRELTEEIRIREESERALRESESKYRDLFEKSSDHLYLHDLEGNLVSTNLAFKDECGYDEKYLQLRNIRDLIPDRFKNKFDDYLKRIREKGHDEDIMVLLTRDSREIVVEYKNKLILDSHGNPFAVRGSGRDVTEKLKMEEQKQRLETQMMRMQRMEAIGTLAGGIAHNFNNLLMGILGNASIASLEMDPSHQVQRNLENIKALVQSGSRLTRQLLEYSKGGTCEVEAISLNDLINRISETFGETRKDIHIHRHFEDDPCPVDADRGQIEQVLLNLFVNAGEAMTGGGDLFVSTKIVSDNEITGKPFKPQPGQYIRMMVRDTGTGIDNKDLEHIFEPFFTTKGLAGGTGLGLSSVYGIVKAHGGYIEARSKKDAGTTFTIYLPASARAVIRESSSAPDLVFGNETILLVDDEEIILETSERLLCYLGYSVIKAEGGEEAINIYRANRDRIHLVILDLVMPRVGGKAVFDALIAMNPDVRVIVSSGYSIDGQAQEIMARGGRCFIQKPFDIKELSAKIRDCLV
jgi:two-component system, cell cycle sensor histidine kinase and response regulator CckA